MDVAEAKPKEFKCHLPCMAFEAGGRSAFCIFHDPQYLESFDVYRAKRVVQEFYDMVNKIDSNSPDMRCIGYHLPAFSIDREIPVEVIFHNAVFHGPADFSNATFTKKSSFMGARFRDGASFFNATFVHPITFQGAKIENTAYFEMAQFREGVDFSKALFAGETIFDNPKFYQTVDFSFCRIMGEASFLDTNLDNLKLLKFSNVYLKDPEHVVFEVKDGRMSEVSFVNTDVSRVRFGESIRFGNGEGNKFQIHEDRELEEKLTRYAMIRGRRVPLKRARGSYETNFPLGVTLGIYRNLRENFEFRMRYDEAGEFFIKEMEIKRNFRSQWLDQQKIYRVSLKQWPLRNLSFIGLYYNLSEYGQSILRPTLFGIAIIALSTFLWFTQPDHSLDFSVAEIMVSQKKNYTLAHFHDSIERSILNFIPLLPAGEGIRLGMMDYLFKIIGGAVTFGLIIIALRRKFERKFRH